MPPASSTSVKQVLGGLQDKAMYSLLDKEIVYNVSWEDPRVDCELLDLGPTDTIMMLASGGCNVLDMVLEGPKKVVAVDLNPRQTALLELKIVCAQTLDHETFFQIFALSNYDVFVAAYDGSGVREKLSDFARAYWDGNKGFFRNLHWSGSSGFAAKWLVRLIRLAGLGKLLDAVRDCKTLEEQIAIYKGYEGHVASLSGFVNLTRRFWCPFLGVPASQVDLFDGNIVKHVVDNLFYNTHIAKDNYFYYAYMFATYTRENCPRYLQPQYYKTLKANVSRIDIRTMTLKDAAALYPDGYFSRYILLDHMDWMPASVICDEWSVFVAKARSDCRVLWRSFASFQHIGPLKYLHFHEENVRAAHKMYPDRVAMYNSTHLATIPPDFTVVPRTDYRPRGTCCDDVTVLYSNFIKRMSGKSHQDKLESFYQSQARSYDVYRHRFLHGRAPMMDIIPTPRGAVWVDMGGGTASNLEHVKAGLSTFSRIVVLDLCRPLLEVARQRVEVNGWDNVDLVFGDATSPDVEGLPKAGTVDLITFSYSITMIPDWRAAIKNAYRLLRPGGYIAVSDFTVTEDHGCVDRRLWPFILSHDEVRPTPEHIPTLQALFREVHLGLGKGGFPYVPFLEAPYYYFVGQKVF